MVVIFCKSRQAKGKIYYPKKGTHFRFFVCPICKGNKV